MSKRNCENKEPKPKWVAENFKSVGKNKKHVLEISDKI